MDPTGRRGFLKHGLVAAGGLGLGWVAWSKLARKGNVPQFHHLLGPLAPVKDQTTGLPLLKLPKGFRYHSFSWAGSEMNDGYPVPGACDGMGVVNDEDGVVTLVRNHELRGSSGPIGGWKLENARKSHGYVFEVHPDGETNPAPIVAMGQFYHEATAIDPRDGIVYMTEDRSPVAGFYRYLPDVPGELQAGGKLQMLRVEGQKDLVGAVALNPPMATGWVDIERPQEGHTPGSHDGAGVVAQGIANGGTAFVSLEGCIYHEEAIYFTSKSGGGAGAGQVFRLDIASNTITLIFEATERNGFSGPDNIIVSPRGSLVICEDRLGLFTDGQMLAGLDQNGSLFAFCQSNPELRGDFGGYDLRKTAVRSEWAGACFSADGQWMFVNLYSPGISLAITGPWQEGLI